MQRYFEVTAPSVPSMVLTLERRGFIQRVPRQARSITLLVKPESLPPVETHPTLTSHTMSNVPQKRIKKPGGWSAVKQHLKDWNAAQLNGLIKDLYASSTDTRTFLDARVQAQEAGGEALATYRKRIVDQFFPARGFGKLKLGEARKAIRDYKKATGNMEGTTELLLTYLENGNAFTCEYGDINEPFYDSLCSVMDELAAVLKEQGQVAYAKVGDRLNRVAAKADGMGWGYGDHITGVVRELEADLGERGPAGS